MGGDGERGGKLRATYAKFSQIAQRLATGITTGAGFSLHQTADELAIAALEISGAQVAYIRVPGFAWGESVLNIFSLDKWCPELASLPPERLKQIAGEVPKCKHHMDCMWPKYGVEGGSRPSSLLEEVGSRYRKGTTVPFYSKDELHHFAWLKSEAFIPLLARENSTPKALLVLGDSRPDHFNARRLATLRQSQGFLNSFYQVADLIEDRLATDRLLRQIAMVLPEFAKAPSLPSFQRALLALLTCEKGFGFNRALLFWMPTNQLPAECQMALGGKGEDWLDSVEQVRAHYARKSLIDYIQDAVEFPIPGEGPVPLRDPLYDDVCGENRLLFLPNDTGIIHSAIERRCRFPDPAIKLTPADPWIAKIFETRKDVFCSKHGEYWLYPLEPFGVNGEQPILGFVIADLAYRPQSHSPGQNFPNLGVAAVVLNLLASIWHARESTESYLHKLTGLDAFTHATPQISTAIHGIRDNLNDYLIEHPTGALSGVTEWLDIADNAAEDLEKARDVLQSTYDTLHDHVTNAEREVQLLCQKWAACYPLLRFASAFDYSGPILIRPEAFERILAILVANIDSHAARVEARPIKVSIAVKCTDLPTSDDENESRVLVTVDNDGPAIPQHFAPFIFANRVSTSVENAHGSGLSNARYLAKAYAGTVELLRNQQGEVSFGVLLNKIGT